MPSSEVWIPEIAVELAADRQIWLAGRVPVHIPAAVIDHAGGVYWQFIHRVLTRRTPLGRKAAKGFTAQGGPLIRFPLPTPKGPGGLPAGRAAAHVADHIALRQKQESGTAREVRWG